MQNIVRIAVGLTLIAPLLFGAGAASNRADNKAPATHARIAAVDVAAAPKAVEPNPLASAAENPLQVAVPTAPETATGQATSFDIDWYSVNGSGTIDAASPNFRMASSVGQAVAGAASSPNFQMGIGFWYGMSGGGCTCSCHGDPVCDGVKVNSQDVVVVINVAFRGTPATFDGGCPRERTDVDCSGFTNSQDVVRIINVAFRGNSITSQFCDACL